MTEKNRFEKWWGDRLPHSRLEILKTEQWTAWQAAREWTPIRTKKIPLNEFVLCGLWVRDRKNRITYFDVYHIRFDDEFEPRDKWDNFLSEWGYDDFTHWYLLPEPPEE